MRGAPLQCGYTLTETLIAAGILSALMAIAAPELARTVQSVHLRGGMEALASGLRLARFEAVKRNGAVVMCKSADGLQCLRQGDWSQGWIVFHDKNNNGYWEPGEDLLYRERLIVKGLRMWGNMHVRDYVSYTAFGKAKTLAGAFQAGTFTVCQHSQATTDAYLVVINIQGRPRVEKTVLEHCT